MDMVMSNGFAELSANEMEMIDGGVDGATVLGGLATFATATACFVAAANPASAAVLGTYYLCAAVAGAQIGCGLFVF